MHVPRPAKLLDESTKEWEFEKFLHLDKYKEDISVRPDIRKVIFDPQFQLQKTVDERESESVRLYSSGSRGLVPL